jgi:DNA-binding MarR family transcriptional regulator
VPPRTQLPSAADRLPVGQLLINLLRLFRAELADRGEGGTGFEGIRPAHLQIFGTIKADGSRLTDLAESSGLSLSATAELVDSLQGLGYLERRPDPGDGRAKLVCLTGAGRGAIDEGRRLIADIEAEWGEALGSAQFTQLCDSMQTLLDQLDPGIRAGYRAGASPPPS